LNGGGNVDSLASIVSEQFPKATADSKKPGSRLFSKGNLIKDAIAEKIIIDTEAFVLS
jgi:hypothetical protein